jgi:hypothetical protein
MKISKKALQNLHSRQAKAALMGVLGFSEVWITKVIKANKPNGPLTTAAAIKVIEQETGMSQEQILEEVSELATK